MEDRKESMSFMKFWNIEDRPDSFEISEETKTNMIESFFKTKDGMELLKKDYEEKLTRLMRFFSWIFDHVFYNFNMEKEIQFFYEKHFNIKEFMTTLTQFDREKVAAYLAEKLDCSITDRDYYDEQYETEKLQQFWMEFLEVLPDFFFHKEIIAEAISKQSFLEYTGQHGSRYRTDIFWIKFIEKHGLPAQLFCSNKKEILRLDHNILIQAIETMIRKISNEVED